MFAVDVSQVNQRYYSPPRKFQKLTTNNTTATAAPKMSALPKSLANTVMSYLSIRSAQAMRTTCKQWGKCTAVWPNLDLLTGERATLTQALTVCNLTNVLSLVLSRNVSTEELLRIRLFPRLTKLDATMCPTINDDVLETIADLTNLRELHLAWYSRFTELGFANLVTLQQLQVLDISHCHPDLNLWPSIGEMLSLTTLNVMQCKINDAALVHIGRLVQLESLNLSHNTRITNNGLQNLQNLTCLRCVDLEMCFRVSELGLAHLNGASITSLKLIETTIINIGELSRFTNLEILQFSEHNARQVSDYAPLTSLCHLHDVTFKMATNEDCVMIHLAAIPNLQRLDLNSSYYLSDAGLAHLTTAKMLTSLNVGFCRTLTDAGIQHLVNLPLKELDLEGCFRIGDVGLYFASRISNLEELDLSACNQKTNVGLAYLAPLQKLRQLGLRRCTMLDEAALSFVGTFSQLQLLDLGYNSWCVTDVSLVHLVNLKSSLTWLSLQDCTQVTDAGMVHIAALDKLQHLNVNNLDHLTDAGLTHITTITSLQSLALQSSPHVTDKGLFQLAKLTELHLLRLITCIGITDVGLDYLLNVPKLRDVQIFMSANVSVTKSDQVVQSLL